MKVKTMRGFSIFLGAALLAATGCGTQHPPPEIPPLCSVNTPHPDAGASTGDAGTRHTRWGQPEQWEALLVQGYDTASHRAPSPARDCTGTAVEWHEPNGCTEPGDNGTVQQGRALTEEDFIESRVDAHHKLVWAPVEFYSNGEGVGPVAYAEITPDRVAIRATGILRAMPRRARLHFETVGDAKFLVAEGDVCTSPTDPTTCHRSVRLMVQHADHFEPLIVSRPGGTCLSPARFDLAREATVDLSPRWRRNFEMASTLTYSADGITVHENVVVKDADPTLTAVPPRVFRRVDSDRILQLESDHLVTEHVSLWARMMDERASVATPLADAGHN